MTTQGDRHTDGGVFEPATVTIRRQVGTLLFMFMVDGLRCSTCGEELITRDTALQREHREQYSLAFSSRQECGVGVHCWTFATPNIVFTPSIISTESEDAHLLARTDSTLAIAI